MDKMPVFVIKAKDELAIATLLNYREHCRFHGLHSQAGEVDKAIKEMRSWQDRNPHAIKMPDHKHVPQSESETHTADTLHKVHRALSEMGFSDQTIQDAVNQMHNAGVLFRERVS